MKSTCICRRAAEFLSNRRRRRRARGMVACEQPAAQRRVGIARRRAPKKACTHASATPPFQATNKQSNEGFVCWSWPGRRAWGNRPNGARRRRLTCLCVAARASLHTSHAWWWGLRECAVLWDAGPGVGTPECKIFPLSSAWSEVER